MTGSMVSPNGVGADSHEEGIGNFYPVFEVANGLVGEMGWNTGSHWDELGSTDQVECWVCATVVYCTR